MRRDTIRETSSATSRATAGTSPEISWDKRGHGQVDQGGTPAGTSLGRRREVVGRLAGSRREVCGRLWWEIGGRLWWGGLAGPLRSAGAWRKLGKRLARCCQGRGWRELGEILGSSMEIRSVVPIRRRSRAAHMPHACATLVPLTCVPQVPLDDCCPRLANVRRPISEECGAARPDATRTWGPLRPG